MSNQTIIYDLSAELLECARLGIEEAGLPTPCRICVVPGEIAWDNCADGGQLEISLNQSYYSNVFPTQIFDDPTASASCNQGIVVGDYTMSLMRCAPGPKGNPPRPPSCDELSAAALLINSDAYVLRSSILCCLKDLKNDRTIIDFRIGPTLVNGPEGGCVGNTIQILVGFTNG